MQFSCSVTKSCLTLWDPMNCSKPGFPGFTISQNLLKFMSIESMMLCSHLILCLLLLPSIFPRIRVFSKELALHIRWPKYWTFCSSSVLPVNIQGWNPLGVTGNTCQIPVPSTPSWRRQWHPTPVLLLGKIPWMEEPGRLQSMGLLLVRHDWVTSLSRIGEGNGNPLQCSCLENPRDGGAWWAAVYGVTQSWTQLKWLSSSSSSSTPNTVWEGGMMLCSVWTLEAYRP